MAVIAFQAITVSHIRIAIACHIRERAGACSFYDLAIEKHRIRQKSEPYPGGKSIQLRHVTIMQALQVLVGRSNTRGARITGMGLYYSYHTNAVVCSHQ